ncbi:ER membrane protein complex subunit 8 isoform X4 [Sciurus carolinensis]|uniref:ER membrane protein complex subunit 8 isoform X4 n=1 Tax=Sciurus carolinensis TaxID=30640 RepID=UPI001FB269DE|nr:ER membrane protein complex subunit 8 isoform X4 [Sciurus carolinensis]
MSPRPRRPAVPRGRRLRCAGPKTRGPASRPHEPAPLAAQRGRPTLTCAAARRDRRDRPLSPGCLRPEERGRDRKSEPRRGAPREPGSPARARRRGGRRAAHVAKRRAALLSGRRWLGRFPAGRRRGRAASGRRLVRCGSGRPVGPPARSPARGRRRLVLPLGGGAARPAAVRARGAAGLSMPGVKLTTQAYCKMLLHGAKYPHCAVNGLLVAEKQKPRKEHLPLGGPGAPHTLFVDCIPLFHGTLALAPMLEVALTLSKPGCGEGGLQDRRGLQRHRSHHGRQHQIYHGLCGAHDPRV